MIVSDVLAAIAADEAALQEISFMLEQLPSADTAAPVETPKPKEKLPSETFADHLIEHFGFDGLPDTVDDLAVDFPKPRNTRTLRAGLELALQRRHRSRAAAQTASSGASTERTDARSPEETAPESGGAGDNQSTLELAQ